MIFQTTLYNHTVAGVPKHIRADIEAVLASYQCAIRPNSAATVRNGLLAHLRGVDGWSGQVRISAQRGLTLTAKKGNTALCLQTGNMARFYADLMKLQAQFVDGKIDSAVYILPTVDMARIMGSNMANYERLVDELTSTFRNVITVPIAIYGLAQTN
jgi:hypothetical protein